MDAAPILALVARLLDEHGLEAVLIGNAAAALHGAPVTTLDLDFHFRPTPANLRKLKALARSLEGVILTPYYPVSRLYRIMRDRDTLQLDFMGAIDGIRSFEGLRSRATTTVAGNHRLRVASLQDIIKSKRAANRPSDKAVLPLLEKTLAEQASQAKPQGDTGGAQEGE